MADLVALSTAANVAAMISLADTAFKTGTQVFDLYCRYRNASSSISQLVDEIKAVTSNTAQVRIFMQEFDASAFAIDNRHTMSHIQQLLCLIDQEFKLLKKLMEDTRPTSSGSWLDRFNQVAGYMRWSLDEHKAAASCTRLHRLSTHMTNALGITGRRNEIVLRNEVSATRAEVVKIADTAKRLQDYMNILAVAPSKNALASTTHATRLPFRNSRGRLRGPRLVRKQEDLIPVIPKNKSVVIPVEQLSMDDSRSAMLSQVSLWHDENDVIEVESLAIEDMVLSLKLISKFLRTAIKDHSLSQILVISSGQAEWIALIIHQLLAHSYMAAAMSLSQECEGFSARDCLTASYGMNDSGSTTQALSSKTTVKAFANGQNLQRKRLTDRLWTRQTFSKATPLGAIEAEIYLIGDCQSSEILSFRMRFSPNQQLSEAGVAVNYASRHITSLVLLDNQPGPWPALWCASRPTERRYQSYFSDQIHRRACFHITEEESDLVMSLAADGAPLAIAKLLRLASIWMLGLGWLRS